LFQLRKGKKRTKLGKGLCALLDMVDNNMLNDGVGDERIVRIPYGPDGYETIAFIHSHTEYQQDPFKDDWVTYVYEYNYNIESYIVDKNLDGQKVVRYLPVGTRNQTKWRYYP